MNELHPDVKFKFSPGCSRSTNIAQKKPTDMEDKVGTFHLEIRRIASETGSEERLGKYELHTGTNVDRTPLLSLSIKGRATTQLERKRFGVLVQLLVLTSIIVPSS